MIEILKAGLFGIVEGITEWLPISSTGHMMILDKIVSLDVTKSFYSLFEVVIQLGAILAVIILYWNKIFPFKFTKRNQINRRNKNRLEEINPIDKTREFKIGKILVDLDIVLLWLKIILACIPAAIIAIKFDEVFDRLFHNSISISLALIIFGIGFIIIEKIIKKKEFKIQELKDITWKTAIIIGVFQLIAAIFPGVSRSGATILGALLIGVSRETAVDFTFCLAIPVMLGASLIKIIKFGFHFKMQELIILGVGVLVSFITSLIVIKGLIKFIKKHDFKVFGYYRIILGLIVLLFIH